MHIDDIYLQNPHYDGSSFDAVPNYTVRRTIFGQLLAGMQGRHIVALQGLRRTGKSVLMEQLLFEEAQSGRLAAPRHLLRFSFERTDDLDLVPTDELRSLLSIYFDQILGIHPAKLRQRVVIAIDEIQNVRNWQSVIKTYYDLNRNFKFIVTGSASLFLNEGSESLAGRIREFTVPCLSFEEFRWFSGEVKPIPFAVNTEGLFKPIGTKIGVKQIEQFERFLLAGGFPESAIMLNDSAQIEEAQLYIRDMVVSKIIQRDLKKYYKVQDTYADRRLFEVCCRESGCFIEVSNLAQEVGMSQDTVKRHLDIFSQCNLISFLPKFDRKLRRQIRASRKVYVASPSILYSAQRVDSTVDTALLGHAAETYAFQRLSAFEPTLFVDQAKGQKEVDFYLPRKKIFIECKYTTRIRPKELEYLVERTANSEGRGVVLTKDQQAGGVLPYRPLASI